MITLLILGLLLVSVPGIAVLVGDHLCSRVETYTISTRELLNVAADVSAGIGTAGTEPARR